MFLKVIALYGDPRLSYAVIFVCKRKLIKSGLADGLKMFTGYLALNRPEKKTTGLVKTAKNECN